MMKIIFILLASIFLAYWFVEAVRATIDGVREYRTRRRATQTLLDHMNELVKMCEDKDQRDHYLSFCLAMTLLAPPSILAPVASEVEGKPATPITGAKAFLRLKSDMSKSPESNQWYFKLQPSGQKALLDIQTLAYALIPTT